MSVQEIINELPRLGPEEFRLVREKVRELEVAGRQAKSAWGKALLEVAGTVDDLPPDLSVNHDHYLYGAPKRKLDFGKQVRGVDEIGQDARQTECPLRAPRLTRFLRRFDAV